MQMRPEFVYFDLGNVLLFFDHGIAMRNMARIANVSTERMRSIVFESDLQIRYETGLISGHQFIQSIGASIGSGVSLDTDAMLQAAADMFIPNMHILPVIERIRSLGIPIGLLSNTCEAHWNWICELRYPQVHGQFSPIVLSFEAKSMKPDRQIYHHAMELAQCAPNKIFFTDDRIDNVQAAREVGWNADVFTSADRLMDLIGQWSD